MISIAKLASDVTTTVTIASIICNVLPNSTVFAAYPRLQRAYETCINFVSMLALNVRKQLPSLDVHIPGLGFRPEKKP